MCDNPNQEFNVQEFNITFEKEKERIKKLSKQERENRLSTLDEVKVEPPILSLSLLQILVNMKESWFGLIDDILNFKFGYDTFFKEHRLFYIGLTIFVFVIIFYIIYNLSVPEELPKDRHINFTLKREDEPNKMLVNAIDELRKNQVDINKQLEKIKQV